MIKRDTHKIIYKLQTILSLILDIVDSEYSFYILIALLITIKYVIIYRYKSRLPIISVDDIRLEVDISQQFKHSTGEEDKSLCVIIKSVQTVSHKVIFIIEKIICNAVFNAHKNSAVLISPCYGNGKVSHIGKPVFKFLLYAAVIRYHNSAVVSLCIYSRRK